MAAGAIDRLEFLPPPTPGLIRALGLAILAHAALLAALTWGLHWRQSPEIVSAQAELWSAIPQQAAPPPAPVPPPPAPPVAQAPPPPPPAAETPRTPDPQIVQERERQRLQKEKEKEKQQAAEQRERQRRALEQQEQQKREQEKRLAAAAKERAAQEAQRKQAADAARRKEDARAEQEAARRLEEQRRANLQRMAGLAGSAGTPSSTGTAVQSSGPSASYGGRLIAKIKPNIVYTETLATNPEAIVEVRTSPDGTIVGSRLTKSSGIKSWDDAVLKAIAKTETLPRDVDGRVPSVLEISFRPRD